MAGPFQGLQRSSRRLCRGPSGAAARARLYVAFLAKGPAIAFKTRLDSYSHSGSERYRIIRIAHQIVLKVALTGGIASGKTTVSRLFAALGAPVIDTDLIARELVEPGTPALQQIAQHFGPAILLPDGSLDRRQLRARIFEHPDERRALEAILHPAIRKEVTRRLEKLHTHYVIVVIPLLVESGNDWDLDRVLLVDAPEARQLERLMRRDGSSASEARQALNAQAGRTQRQAIADDVVLNDGDAAQLESEVKALDRYYRNLVGA